MYKLYKHTTPSGKVYIGITCNEVKKRWSNGNGYVQNQYFYRAIRKYGWENIKHEILLTGLTKEKAEWWEKRMIKKYRSTNPKYGYNHGEGGVHPGKLSLNTRRKMMKVRMGHLVSEETRRKLSKSMMGNTNGINGQPRPVLCRTTGQKFDSLVEAANHFGISSQNIGKACRGELKHSGGMKWEYLEEEDGK